MVDVAVIRWLRVHDLQGTPFYPEGPLQGRFIPAVLASGCIDWTCDRFLALTREGPSLSAIGKSVVFQFKMSFGQLLVIS